MEPRHGLASPVPSIFVNIANLQTLTDSLVFRHLHGGGRKKKGGEAAEIAAKNVLRVRPFLLGDKMLRVCGALSVVLALSSLCAAEIRSVRPANNWRAALTGLQPGDEVVFYGGSGIFDQGTSRLGVSLVGTRDRPIVIRGATNEVRRLQDWRRSARGGLLH